MNAITRRATMLSGLAVAACSRTPSPILERVPAGDGHPHVLMRVGVAGRTVTGVIDNGAPVSSIDAAVAREAGLVPERVLASGRAVLPTQTFHAGAQAFQAQAVIDDLTELSIATEQPIGAIVGMDLFRAFAVGVVARDAIELYSPEVFVPPAGARAVALGRVAGGEPSAAINVDGGSAQALVDLGASAAVLISQAFAGRHQIGKGRQETTRQAIVLKDGVLTPADSRMVSAAVVRFAGARFEDVPVNVMPDDPGPFAAYDVVVGAPLLTKFEIYFDLPQTLWTIDSGRVGEPFVRRYTGLGVVEEAQGLRIRHIGEGSPAQKAGLKTGDVIVRLDGGRPAAAMIRRVGIGQEVQLTLADGRALTLIGARHY